MKTFTEKIGDLGEILGGYKTALIFNGEAQKETLKGEGKGALDFQLKYVSPYSNHHHQIGIQVKTGNSYGSWVKTKNKWRINISKEHANKWKENNQPVLLIWNKPDSEIKTYWKFFGKKTSTECAYISKSHILNPSARFEIDRLVELEKRDNQIIPKFTIKPYSDVKTALEKSKPKYHKIRQIKKTLFGSITISNYAFRHLTRDSRNRKHVVDSLNILPYADKFLNYSPNKIITLSQDTARVNNQILVKRKVLFIYKNVRFSDKGMQTLFIRLKEKTLYPNNWSEKSLINQNVEHNLILESIYRK